MREVESGVPPGGSLGPRPAAPSSPNPTGEDAAHGGCWAGICLGSCHLLREPAHPPRLGLPTSQVPTGALWFVCKTIESPVLMFPVTQPERRTVEVNAAAGRPGSAG